MSSLGFSRIIESAPNTPKNGILYLKKRRSLSLLNAFPRNIFSKREERTLLGTLVDVTKFTCVTTIPESKLRNINLIPFRNVRGKKIKSFILCVE